MSETPWRSRLQPVTRVQVPLRRASNPEIADGIMMVPVVGLGEVLPMDPADVFKTLLETAGVNINGWGVYVSKEPTNPHRAITCYNTGGLQPSPKWSLDYPSVQVRVRGFPNSYQESRAKATECRDALLGIDPQSVNNGNDWLVSIVVRADIQDLGFDSTNRPLHTINFNVISQPQASGYRVALPDIASPTPPVPDLPLDLVPNAAGAFSFRKLRSAYIGGAAVVRRGLDNTQLGIGFDANGNFDESAFNSFVAGSNAFDVAWGDQSVNNSSAVNSVTGASQPPVAKRLNYYGNVGTNATEVMESTSKPENSNIFVGGGSVYIVCAMDQMTGGAQTYCGKGAGGWAFYSYPVSGNMKLWLVQDGAAGQGYWNGAAPITLNAIHILEVRYDSSSPANQPTFAIDGVDMANEAVNPYGAGVNSDADTGIQLLNSATLGAGKTLSIHGVIYESFFYDRILTSDERTALINNIKMYYGMLMVGVT